MYSKFSRIAVRRCHESSRQISFLSATDKKNLNIYEIQIPVPWGHISGKWWGDKNAPPVVALHEYRQNAAAFDKLIPKLNVASVLAVDLPGHGQSSHFPEGIFLSHLHFLIALRYVMKHFATNEASLLGHGFGSYLALLYCGSHQQEATTLMCIESSHHLLSEYTCLKSNAIGEFSDGFFKIHDSRKPAYTEDELLAVISSTTGGMSTEAAKIILTRASKRENGQLYYSNDPRYAMQCLYNLSDEDTLTMVGRVFTKTAMISNTFDDELEPLKEEGQSSFFDPNRRHMVRRRGPHVARQLFSQSLECLRDSSRFLATYKVRAPQHILLDSADEVATHLNSFLGTDLECHEIYGSND